MLTLLICVAIGALLGLATGYEPEVDWFLGAICGAILGFALSLILGSFIYTDSTWKTHDTRLVSLADASDTHGSFFLGSGSMDSSPSFTWYESKGMNDYIRKDVDASEATIHYTTGTPHYVKREKKSTVHGFVHKWGWNTSSPYGEHYDFYVPKGSIVQSYKLDNH